MVHGNEPPVLRAGFNFWEVSAKPRIERVWHANIKYDGADKVWKLLGREGLAVVRRPFQRFVAGFGSSVGNKKYGRDDALAEKINGRYEAEFVECTPGESLDPVFGNK